MHQNSLAPPGRSQDRASPCGPQGNLLGLCLDVWSQPQPRGQLKHSGHLSFRWGDCAGEESSQWGSLHSGWSPALPFILPVASVKPLDASQFSRLQRGVTRVSWAAPEIPAKMIEWARKQFAASCTVLCPYAEQPSDQQLPEPQGILVLKNMNRCYLKENNFFPYIKNRLGKGWVNKA